MRILFFTFEFPPLGGGVATAAEALVGELVKSGVEVDVVTGGWVGQKGYDYKLQATGYRLYRVPVYWNHKQAERGPGVVQMFLYLVMAFGLGIFIRVKLFFSRVLSTSFPQEHPKRDPFLGMPLEVVTHSQSLDNSNSSGYALIHVFGFPSGVLGLLLGWNIPYVISLRGVDVPGYNPKYNLIHRLFLPITKLSWSRANIVVANSEGLKALVNKVIPDLPVRIIPNGVDTNIFQPIKQSEKFKNFTVTAGGTLLNSKKGLADLISAFAIFEQQHKGVKLLLVGEGDLRNKLEAQVEELGVKKSVKFVGRKSRKWLSINLPKCHVCCLPSVSESMSNALLEAMACGLPLIVTPSSQGLIDGNGLVVDYQSPEKIAVCLEKIYTDINTRDRMGRRSRKLAKSFSWKSVGKKYLEIYQHYK